MSYKAEIIEAFKTRSVKNVYIAGVKANKYTINDVSSQFVLKKYDAMLNYKIVTQLSRRISPGLTNMTFVFNDNSSVLYLKTNHNSYPAYGLIVVECLNGKIYTLDVVETDESKSIVLDLSKMNILIKL